MAALICLPMGVKAEAKTLPYSYGFENNDLAAEGWATYFATNLTGNNNECQIIGAAKKTGDLGFRFSSYNTNGANQQYLISPELTAPNGVIVTFEYAASSTSSKGETFKVGYSTTDTDIASFTFGDEQSTKVLSWQTFEATFPAGTKYIAIFYYPTYQYRLYIDDFTFSAPPTCPKPEELTVSNVEATSATVSWTTEAATSILEYKLTSATDWTVVSNATSPYNLTGLTSSSDYDVRVKIDCGTDGESGYAESSFNTPCGAKAIPFNSDFTSIDCWTMENCHESTGLSGDAFRFHWTSNYPQYLISPELVASEKKVAVSFEYKVESTSYPESFAVGYSTTTNDLTSFTWGEETANCVNTSYVEYSETLPENVKYVAIKCTSNDKHYLYIDNFSVAEYEAPACEMPTGLAASEVTANSAKIAWASEAAAWKLQTSADGENWTDVEGEITNPYTLNALTENTKYYVRVCANCGANGDSEWTAAINFTTECAVKSLPFEQKFDAATLPNCWETDNVSNGKWAIYNWTEESYDGYSIRFAGKSGYSATLQSPAIALNDKAQLSFYWKNSSGISVDLKISKDGGVTKEALENSLSAAQTTYKQQAIDLSAYAGETVILYWTATAASGSSPRYVYMDELRIDYAPVAAPTELAVEPGDQQATISWTNIEENATYNLRHKATAAEEWTIVNGVTNPYVLGGLTNGTEYEVQVQAVASANRVSEWTESATFTPVACASIETVTFGDKTYNSVVVNWTATAAGTWEVRYIAEGDADYTDAGTDLTDQTITLNNLKTNVAYTIEVKAACSEEWKAAEALTLHYSSPTNITASYIEDVTATLSWDAVADAPDGYKYIVVARGAEVDWASAKATDALTAELSELSGLTDYDFYVAALYGENLGTSTKAEFATIAYAPANLTAGDITTTTATFTWGANGAATQYQWSTDGKNWSAAQEELTATVTDLTAATTYTFYVRSYYAEGKYSEPVILGFTTACGVYNLPFEENFDNGQLNCWTTATWSENSAAGTWSLDNSYSHSGYTALRFNAKTDKTGVISSPEIALGQKAELSFFLRNVYGNNDGYVEGKVIAADVENEENKVEAEFIHSNADDLMEQKLDLSALLGKTVKITFLATGVGTSTNASLYIDDVKVTVKPDDDPTAIGNTSAAKQVIKTIENDQMVIIIDGVKYNAQGQKL